MDNATDLIEPCGASPASGEMRVSADLVRALRDDGAVLLKNALNPDEMAIVKAAFDHHLANVSSGAINRHTEDTEFLIDLHNEGMWRTPPYQRLWNETKLLDLAQGIFGTPDVWLWYEQIFFKQGSPGATVRRTEWHQDLVYDPLEGNDLLRFWISLESLDKGYALEFVRGSHRGPVYDPGTYGDAARTANNGQPMPPMPDIEADRSQWDIITWAMEPGDVLAFHPGVIHGGGPTKPGGVRRTVTMILLGRDARYSPRPAPPGEFNIGGENGPYQTQQRMLAGVQPGDAMSTSKAPRLR